MERTQVDRTQLGRVVGAGFVVMAVTYALAGMLHPGSSAPTLREVTIDMLADPAWPLAHWMAFISFVLTAWLVWLLSDAGVTRGSASAQAGARLVIVAGVVMAVQSAVELVAPGEHAALVAGEPAPLVGLVETLQTVGWPALSLGYVLLMLGCGRALAPRAVVALGVAGSVLIGAAGLLVEGFGLVSFGALFQAGALQTVWLLWAGVTLLRRQPSADHAATRVAVPVG